VAGVEQDRAGRAQVQRRRAQVAQRPQPDLPLAAGRAAEQVGEEQIQQIERAILRALLHGLSAGEQGGDPPLRRHAGDRLCLGGGRMAGERPHAAGWDGGEIE